ncbi:FAD-dependent oxidoreductase [Nocardia sp. NPDC049707]|uniref:NAD(P)/FAD-dependent oxidoreductase n=1 Tax=Nocardia sp. NPDC049707 TaxID=3154735 RepID=UPI003430F1B9
MSNTVVVVGGGYGGAAVAKALEAEAEVILIDPRDGFVNAAGSLRAMAQPEWAGNMFFPYDTMFTRTTVVRDRVIAADPAGVTVASGHRIAADYLVLATGSTYAYPAKPVSDSIDAARDDLHRTHKELLAADRVLILGAGPVGLELAGEIAETWPGKEVTIVDPNEQLLPGFRDELREDLSKQLAESGITLRLGTRLHVLPSTEAGKTETFTVTPTVGDPITADIWFRAHGVRINSDYLTDGRIATPTPAGQVPVAETLQVRGHDHVYAIGDITDVPEAKMAGYAMQHAEVVARNITAQLRSEQPSATYQPLPFPMILLPLGSRGGVGQLPSADGPSVVDSATVSQYKGADLFTSRFTEQFGPTAA